MPNVNNIKLSVHYNKLNESKERTYTVDEEEEFVLKSNKIRSSLEL